MRIEMAEASAGGSQRRAMSRNRPGYSCESRYTECGPGLCDRKENSIASAAGIYGPSALVRISIKRFEYTRDDGCPPPV